MELSRYCLDTSAYSQFRSAHPPVVQHLASSRWIGIPAIVLGELRHGFLCGGRAKKNEEMLGAFLSHPFVETLDVDDEASHLYARLTSELRALGRPIPTNDAWIAALSLREGAEVLTYDEHFRTLPGVKAKILSVVQ